MSRSRNTTAAPSSKIDPSREVQILLSVQSLVLEVRTIVFDVGGSGRQEIRIVLADDHAVVRAGLRALLDKQPGFVVIGEAQTGTEAVALTASARPHVGLMDLAMPGGGGIDATRRITMLGLGTKVLVITALPQEQQVCDALEAGASRLLRQDASVVEFFRAVRTVASDRLFLDEDAGRLGRVPR